jgi:hypothetical protein
MQHFDFKERNLISGPHLLGLLLVITGIFVLISPAFLSSGSSIEKVLAVGMVSVIIGLLIILTYKGTLIDFKKRNSENILPLQDSSLESGNPCHIYPKSK